MPVKTALAVKGPTRTADVPLKDIIILQHPFLDTVLNPRGKFFETARLQKDMSMNGQRRDAHVLEVDGKFYLIDGHRRLTAAEALGWKTLRCEIETLPVLPGIEKLVQMMMTADNNHELLRPTQKARGWKVMVSAGMSAAQCASTHGLKTEVVLLHLELLDAPESVQIRVDTGELSLSAWKKLRNQPKEVQEKVGTLEKPTIENVQKEIRKAKGAGQTTMFEEAIESVPESDLLASLHACKMLVDQCWPVMEEWQKEQALFAAQELLASVGGKLE